MKKLLIVGACLTASLLTFGFRQNNEEVLDLERYIDYKEQIALAQLGSGEEVVYTTFEKEYRLNGEELVEEVVEEEKTQDTYIVKSGDSLYKISKNLGIDMNILILNNPHVKHGRLNIGDELSILEGNSIVYQVEKGDSLIKIANRFNISTKTLIDRNKLDSTVVRIGQELIVENPDMTYVMMEVERQKGFRVKDPLRTMHVTSPFGKRYHPVHKVMKFHKGVDLRARYVDLYAAASGRVSIAGWVNGYGKLIVIKHPDGYETRYAHLNKIGVKVGDRVEAGRKIGQTGNTGVGTAPHLHFEVRKNGEALNPLKYID